MNAGARAYSRPFIHTYCNNINKIIIRKSFQHFIDRSPDQFKSQSRYTSTSTENKDKLVVVIHLIEQSLP